VCQCVHPEQLDFGWGKHCDDETPHREGLVPFPSWLRCPTNRIQVYPVAYLEFVEEDGKRRRIGPMGEKEEMAARDAWLVGDHRKPILSVSITSLPTGEEGCRSSETSERVGGSHLNPRRLR
jgi:hypothetical protein